MASELEKHRTAWRLNGIPVYEPGTDDIAGFVDEPEWKWDDLDAEQQAEVNRLTSKIQETGRFLSWEKSYGYVLAEYGIACPHKWTAYDSLSPWLSCQICGSTKERPGRVQRLYNREAGIDRLLWMEDPPPLVWRVPIPRPVTAMAYVAPDGIPDLNIDVEEWRWVRDHYELASRPGE